MQYIFQVDYYFLYRKNNTFERMLDNNEEHVEELVWYNEAAVFDLEMDGSVEELRHRTSVITRMDPESSSVAGRDYKEKIEHFEEGTIETAMMRDKKDNGKVGEENMEGVDKMGSSEVEASEDPVETTHIKGFWVSNYINPKEASSLGKEPPATYISDKFKPVVVSLNNKINFYATMDSIMINNKARSQCNLYPVCNISFSASTRVGTVMILEGEDHPRAGRISLVCAHHSAASGQGIKLQTQKRMRQYSACKENEQVAKKLRFDKIQILKNEFTKNKLAGKYN